MSHESSPSNVDKAPSKGTRLKEIFRSVSNGEPAEDAYGAHKLIEEGFDAVEDTITSGDRMEVLPFEEMDSLSYAGKQIFYSIYNSHVVFISKNGAIDIRGIDKVFPVTKKLLDKNPEFPRTNMKPIFSKPGADGMGVW